ncbi:hypothetical protein [Escherichia coli]|uniref:hypothetical protein n=1 Tax=Escherichia coli TaxID=562 RepID=UPI000BE5D15F|nr:hypothetical protein [Escherichia coli]EFN7526993.1 hypothetical protein [Escherichia coli]EHL6280008.1 hypothetical protein [Escherichia coli]EHT4088226.1 hypothetical protein [Escherichia coli]EJP9078659.1 hypothetical protein [Escherichia coli]EJQ5986416.1 hypothetical protein [Escherichia coli]
MAVQLFKTFLNQIPLFSSLQSGTLPLFGYSGRVGPMKKAHTGESRLKWEAKDSSKLIGNKDHALRRLSSPMVGIRQIRLIT